MFLSLREFPRRTPGVAQLPLCLLLLLCVVLPTVPKTPVAAPEFTFAPVLSRAEAISLALNDFTATVDGFTLRHPYHTAAFTAQGLEFAPLRGGPAWRWRLVAVTAGEVAQTGVDVGAVDSVSDRPGTVVYPRGGLVEVYLARETSVEQQFLIPERLPLGGADLVIAGVVDSTELRGLTSRATFASATWGPMATMPTGPTLLPLPTTAGRTSTWLCGAAMTTPMSAWAPSRTTSERSLANSSRPPAAQRSGMTFASARWGPMGPPSSTPTLRRWLWTAKRTGTWWSGRAMTMSCHWSTTSVRSLAGWSLRVRAPGSAATFASATWDPMGI